MFSPKENNNNEKTTARELANELGGFISSLRETGERLREEKEKIKTTRESINEEFTAKVKEFVDANLNSFDGADFKRFAKTGDNTPELTAQSLTYLRDKMLDARNATLDTLSKEVGATVTLGIFDAGLDAARSEADTQKEAFDTAAKAYNAAQGALNEWRDSAGYALLQADAELKSMGTGGFVEVSRKEYENNGFFKKMFSGKEKKFARAALEAYGHGENGKDAFNDLAGFVKQEADATKLLAETEKTYQAAKTENDGAQEMLSRFTTAQKNLKTDAQIVDALRTAAADYFKTPAFVTEAAKEFGRNFSQPVAIMSAKLSTLDKLEDGVAKKLDGVEKNAASISAQYNKLNKMKPYQQVKVNLDKLQKKHRTQMAQSDKYATSASQSCSRISSYGYHGQNGGHTTVYVDNSPSFFETMLLYHILSSNGHSDVHHHHHYDTPAADNNNNTNDFNNAASPDAVNPLVVPVDANGLDTNGVTPVDMPVNDNFQSDSMSVYSADLLGVDKGDENLDLPADTFEHSPEELSEMEDMGVSADEFNEFSDAESAEYDGGEEGGGFNDEIDGAIDNAENGYDDTDTDNTTDDTNDFDSNDTNDDSGNDNDNSSNDADDSPSLS